MSNIENNLETIRKGVYGKDVRQAIHDAIEECYADGHAGAVDLIARERINTLIGGTGDLVEVPLFEELELFAYDQTFTIDPDEYSISDFDYIAVYYKVVASGAPEVKWYTANDFLTLPVVISGVFLENAGHKLSAREIHIRCTDTDDQTFEVYLANNWKLNGSDAADGGTYTEVEATDEEKAGIISMISGIKFAPSAEVADIRVGEDGTTYESAGEAVRTQISDVKSQIAQGGMKDSIKQALLGLADAVGYKNDEIGAEARQALYNALYTAELLSISAVFTQGDNVIYTHDSLNSLKQYLTVTANYDDGTHSTVTTYTLSGTLTEGTSTITVSYDNKTATFTVNVTAGVPTDTYSMYDYIQALSTASVNVNRMIRLNTYTNLDVLSTKMKLKVLSGYSQGTAIIGVRTASGATSSFAMYAGDTTVPSIMQQYVHGQRNDTSNTITTDTVFDYELRNTSASPSSIVMNGVETSFAWSNTLTNPYALALFANPAYNATTQYVYNSFQIGEFILTQYDGTEVGHYFPVKRNADNVLGMYDIISGNMYTCSSVTSATVGNSSCLYTVGNWS